MSIQRGWPILPHGIKIPDFLMEAKWRTHTVSYYTKDDIPNKPGFYLFTASPFRVKKNQGIFSEFKTIMYVGRASENGSLRDRYRRHYRRPKFQKCQRTYMKNFQYSYIVIEDLDEIKNLPSYEQLIINIFGPPLNDRNEVAEEVFLGKI
jgi:excinuclease UvrABC nuclease subunit